MAWVTARRWLAGLAMAGFVIVSYFVAVSPRWDFPYPVHVDEWTHLAYAEALVQAGRVPHVEPLYGLDAVGFRPELGFRALLAELHLATGAEWEGMFPALAGALFVIFAVEMLYLGRLIGAGPLIGIMALGTPSSLRLLGPAFVVPVTVGLILLAALPLVLLQPSLRGRWRGTVLAGILLAAIMIVHPLTGLVAAPLAAGIAVYLITRHGPAASRPLWACVAVGLLLPLIWFWALSGPLRAELLAEATRSVDLGQGLVTDFARRAGAVRLSLFAISVFAIIFWKGLAGLRPAYLVLLGVYAVALLFIGLHTVGIVSAANLYDRSWLYLDVLLSVIAGLGLAIVLERLSLSRHRVLRAVYQARVAALLVLAGLIVANVFYVQARQPWYRLASEDSMADFRWIRLNLSEAAGVTLLDPFLAVTYPAVAGRPVYASAAEPKPSSEERVQRAWELLESPQPDVEALRRAGIGVVYKPLWQTSEGVEEVRPGIFIVGER